MAPPDAEPYESQRRCIEELKAEIGTLRHQVGTLEEEKAMTAVRHDAELEDQKRRAQEDFEKKQAAESEMAKALRQAQRSQVELEDLREAMVQEKAGYERRARDTEEQNRLLSEQLEDLSSARDEAARMNDKKVADLQMQLESTQKMIQEFDLESKSRESVLQQTQAQVGDKETQIGKLEAEILRLKAQTGDAETMDVIRRELTEQVQHIRTVEATNREQLAELKHLRQINRAVEVVEEEKRSLQRKLEAAALLEAELAEARIQRQRLEDEKLAWTSYLRSVSENEGDDMDLDSPEAVARALVQERLTSASYVEKMGSLQAELTAQDATIKALERETAKLKADVEKAKSAAVVSGGDKARTRLDRQRALAVKEVEYLRAQLRSFDTEDSTFHSEAFADESVKQIQGLQGRVTELESLVDQYKDEVQNLHAELSSLESPLNGQPMPGSKRQRSVEPSEGPMHEQLGELTRKNRKLQHDLSSTQTQLAISEKELAVSREQLAAANERSKFRILQLNANPTSDFEAIKTSTLAALRKENAELLAHIQSPTHSFPTLPASMLEAAQREIAEAKAETASAQKSSRRLKEVWSAKSAEFKEAIFSTLGWTVTFMPNGKMRVESTFYPSMTDEHENSIVFDGEKGTMKAGERGRVAV